MTTKILVLLGISLIGSISIPIDAIGAAKPLAISSQQTTTKSSIKTIDWDVLCAKFPLNSRCLEGKPEIIKISLDDYGAQNEWIRIDKKGNQVKLLYTRQTSGDVVGQVLDGIVDAAVPFPLPFSVYPKQWVDCQTTKIIFQPDNCQLNPEENIQENLANCNILGKDFLNLPPEMNIRAGIFTLEYIEGELIRTITFRIPVNAESETGLVVVE
jgi:hypothetical protein